MIIRPDGTSQFLITQPDHAALACRIMQEWSADGLQDSPRRSLILLAIEEHDNGWREVDVAPIVDEATGRIVDFVHAPDAVRRSVWPRGVDRLRRTPYAAALVAEHALHIYRRYRASPDWTPFFVMMEAARDLHLGAGSLSLDELRRDYFFLRVGDLASLTFCNGWSQSQIDESGYAVRLDGERLVITPDPFSGGQVSIEIAARPLPNRPFHSASDLQHAFHAASSVVLTGVAAGT